MIDEQSVKRFATLFRGNDRSFGQWDPARHKDKSSRTEKSAYKLDHFELHLNGAVGLGIVPIRDDGMCMWGAIDIDNHGQTVDTDIKAVEKRVAEKEMPLIACRSKSGGVHLYFFASEPVRAEILRKVLQRWAAELKIDGVDCIYPKQARLATNDEGVKALGNWINLPYFDAENTPRYAVSNGKPVNLDSFLSMAESIAVDTAGLNKLFGDDTTQMPPCMQARLRSGGFQGGERNDGVYQCAVYCRKKDPETARDAAHDLSQRFMLDNPLPFKERDKTIRSAMGRSYNYKCEVFKDVCDREACRKLKYGISEAEYENMGKRETMPVFSNLVKYHNCDPVRFDLTVGLEESARKIEGLTIDVLSNFSELRKEIMVKTHAVLPRLKGDEWDRILNDLFASVSVEEIPEDSTPEGIVKTRLIEFARKADLNSDGTDHKDRTALLRGVPVVQLLENELVVLFRHVDFVAYLQRTKTDLIKNKDLWFKANRNMGVKNARVRVGKQVINVWYVMVDGLQEERQDVPNFNPEY